MLFWETKSSDDNWQKSVLMYKHFDSSSEARGCWQLSSPVHQTAATATGWTWSFVSQSESVVTETLASSGTDRGAKTLPMGEDLLPAYTTEMMFLTAKADQEEQVFGTFLSTVVMIGDSACSGCLKIWRKLTWQRHVQDKVLEAFQVFYK